MKRMLALLVTVLALQCAAATVALSSPLLYVFEGTVHRNPFWECTQDPNPGCGIRHIPALPGMTIPRGTHVTFGVILDVENPPFPGFPDDPGEWYTEHQFFASYLWGPSPWANGTPDYKSSIATDLYMDGRTPRNEGCIFCAGGNWYEHEVEFWPAGLRLGRDARRVSEWVVGERVMGLDTFNDETMWIGYDLELTRIEPVPEPASLLLFGTGLVGLRAWRRQ